MTTSTATEVAKRKAGRAQIKRTTFREDLLSALRAQVEAESQIRWPHPKYQTDPVGFFREILGVEPWHRQRELLEAVRDYDRVACKSGRRVSKSHSVAGLALWRYCSFPDARVIITSTTDRQVNAIIWRELQMLRARSGRCVDCKRDDPNGPTPCPHSAKIGGQIGTLARTGLKPGVEGDHREIVGFTASEAEAFQGIAGSNLFFLVDEASGVAQMIYDAIEGNRAGGGKVLLTGNPTQNEGEFFEAFHSKRADPEDPESIGYYTLTISSEESPNVIAEDDDLVPGLATAAYLRERKQEWGEGSAMWLIHVEGKFALNEEGRIFSIEAIASAEQRWHDLPVGRERLWLGLDPAGASGTGDETAWAPRRGNKIIELITARGLSEEAHLVRTLGLLSRHRHRYDREPPVVVLDREGAVGARVFGLFHDFAERNPEKFVLVAVRASDRAHRQPMIYDRVRDELIGNLEIWLREGGALPEDLKLNAELHALEWHQQASGRMKVTPKREIKKHLGRSPDRLDAVALSVWVPLHLRDGYEEPPPPATDYVETPGTAAMDPYAALNTWR